MPLKRSRMRAAVGALIIAGSVAATAAAPASAATCPKQPTKKTFHWLNDFNEYYLAPGGEFEPGTPAWTYTGGAAPSSRSIVDFMDTGRSLYVPTGGTAASPSLCIDPSNVHLRLGADATGGSLKIEAITGGKTYALSTLSGYSYLMARISDYVPLATKLSIPAGSSKSVKLKITAVGAPWVLDTVSIDPRASR